MDSNEDCETCWICLEGIEGVEINPGPLHANRLIKPCRCPRVVHSVCLAKWQLSQSGRSEEKFCRFCKERLPDWQANLALPGMGAVEPVMSVHFNGQTHMVKVKPGEAGRMAFIQDVRRLLRLREHQEFSITFECKVPGHGMFLDLKGLSSYDAAVFCAAMTAVERQRLVAQKASKSRGGGGGGGVNSTTCSSSEPETTGLTTMGGASMASSSTESNGSSSNDGGVGGSDFTAASTFAPDFAATSAASTSYAAPHTVLPSVTSLIPPRITPGPRSAVASEPERDGAEMQQVCASGITNHGATGGIHRCPLHRPQVTQSVRDDVGFAEEATSRGTPSIPSAGPMSRSGLIGWTSLGSGLAVQQRLICRGNDDHNSYYDNDTNRNVGDLGAVLDADQAAARRSGGGSISCPLGPPEPMLHQDHQQEHHQQQQQQREGGVTRRSRGRGGISDSSCEVGPGVAAGNGGAASTSAHSEPSARGGSVGDTHGSNKLFGRHGCLRGTGPLGGNGSSSSFLPTMSKPWPDRRGDGNKFILSGTWLSRLMLCKSFGGGDAQNGC